MMTVMGAPTLHINLSQSHRVDLDTKARISPPQPPLLPLSTSTVNGEGKPAPEHECYSPRAPAQLGTMDLNGALEDLDLQLHASGHDQTQNSRPIEVFGRWLTKHYRSADGSKITDWTKRLTLVSAGQFGPEWVKLKKLSENTMLLTFMLEEPIASFSTAGRLSPARFGAFYVLMDRDLTTQSVGVGQYLPITGSELYEIVNNSMLTTAYDMTKAHVSQHVAYDDRAKVWMLVQKQAIITHFTEAERQLADREYQPAGNVTVVQAVAVSPGAGSGSTTKPQEPARVQRSDGAAPKHDKKRSENCKGSNNGTASSPLSRVSSGSSSRTSHSMESSPSSSRDRACMIGDSEGSSRGSSSANGSSSGRRSLSEQPDGWEESEDPHSGTSYDYVSEHERQADIAEQAMFSPASSRARTRLPSQSSKRSGKGGGRSRSERRRPNSGTVRTREDRQQHKVNKKRSRLKDKQEQSSQYSDYGSDWSEEFSAERCNELLEQAPISSEIKGAAATKSRPRFILKAGGTTKSSPGEGRGDHVHSSDVDSDGCVPMKALVPKKQPAAYEAEEVVLGVPHPTDAPPSAASSLTERCFPGNNFLTDPVQIIKEQFSECRNAPDINKKRTGFIGAGLYDPRLRPEFVGLQLYTATFAGKSTYGFRQFVSEHPAHPHVIMIDTNKPMTLRGLSNTIRGMFPHYFSGRLTITQLVFTKDEEGDDECSSSNVRRTKARIRNDKSLQDVIESHVRDIAALQYLGQPDRKPIIVRGEQAGGRLLMRLGITIQGQGRPTMKSRCPTNILTDHARISLSMNMQNVSFTLESRQEAMDALLSTVTESGKEAAAITNMFSYYGYGTMHNVVCMLDTRSESELTEELQATHGLLGFSQATISRLASSIKEWGRQAIMDTRSYPFRGISDDLFAPMSPLQLPIGCSDDGASGPSSQDSFDFSLSSMETDGSDAAEAEAKEPHAEPAHAQQDPSPEAKSDPRSRPAPKDEGQGGRAQPTLEQGTATGRSTHAPLGEEGNIVINPYNNDMTIQLHNEFEYNTLWHDRDAKAEAHVNLDNVNRRWGPGTTDYILENVVRGFNGTARPKGSISLEGASAAGKSAMVSYIQRTKLLEASLELVDTPQFNLENWEDFANELTTPGTNFMELQTRILNVQTKQAPRHRQLTLSDRAAWSALPYMLHALEQGQCTPNEFIAMCNKIMRQGTMSQAWIFLATSRDEAMSRLHARGQAGDGSITRESLGTIRGWHLTFKAILQLWDRSCTVMTAFNDTPLQVTAGFVVDAIKDACRNVDGLRETLRGNFAEQSNDAAGEQPYTTHRAHAPSPEGNRKVVQINIVLRDWLGDGATHQQVVRVPVSQGDTDTVIFGKLCRAVIVDTGKFLLNRPSEYACIPDRGARSGREVPIDDQLERHEDNSYVIVARATSGQQDQEQPSSPRGASAERIQNLLHLLRQIKQSTPVEKAKEQANYGIASTGCAINKQTRGLRLRRDLPNPYSVPMQFNGVPSQAAQSKLHNNTEPTFSLANLESMLKTAGNANHFPEDLLDEAGASRHCTLTGNPLHPNCPRPVRDIPKTSVIYVEYFHQQTSDIEDLLNDTEGELIVGSDGTTLQANSKTVKALKTVGEYMTAADGMDMWLVATGRASQGESLEHRGYVRGIRDLCTQYSWEAVIKYDHTFRALKFAGEIESWDSHRPELVCRLLLPGLKVARQARSTRASNKGGRGSSGTGAKRKRSEGRKTKQAGGEPPKKKARSGGRGEKQPCRRFNSAQGCSMKTGEADGECWFRHQCSVCGSGAHGKSGHK